jgi:hypothetical protein
MKVESDGVIFAPPIFQFPFFSIQQKGCQTIPTPHKLLKLKQKPMNFCVIHTLRSAPLWCMASPCCVLAFQFGTAVARSEARLQAAFFRQAIDAAGC